MTFPLSGQITQGAASKILDAPGSGAKDAVSRKQRDTGGRQQGPAVRFSSLLDDSRHEEEPKSDPAASVGKKGPSGELLPFSVDGTDKDVLDTTRKTMKAKGAGKRRGQTPDEHDTGPAGAALVTGLTMSRTLPPVVASKGQQPIAQGSEHDGWAERARSPEREHAPWLSLKDKELPDAQLVQIHERDEQRNRRHPVTSAVTRHQTPWVSKEKSTSFSSGIRVEVVSLDQQRFLAPVKPAPLADGQLWQGAARQVLNALENGFSPLAGTHPGNARMGSPKVLKTLQIQLYPEHLGRVTARFALVDGRLDIAISLPDKALAAHLRKGLDELARKLKAQYSANGHAAVSVTAEPAHAGQLQAAPQNAAGSQAQHGNPLHQGLNGSMHGNGTGQGGSRRHRQPGDSGERYHDAEVSPAGAAAGGIYL